MKSPQKENGFTPIANELLDALSRVDFSPNEIKVLFSIIRKTYGWGKKEDQISFSQFCQSTGLPRRSIIRSLGALKTRNIITVSDAKNSKINTYKIQKNYALWLAPNGVAYDEGGVSAATLAGGVADDTRGGVSGVTGGVSAVADLGVSAASPTIYNKENLQKKGIFESFSEDDLKSDIRNRKKIGQSAQYIKEHFLSLGIAEAILDKMMYKNF